MAKTIQPVELIYTDHFRQRFKQRFSWRSLKDIPAIIENCKIPSKKCIRKLNQKGRFVNEPITKDSFWLINPFEKMLFLVATNKRDEVMLITIINLIGYNHAIDS